MLDRIDDYVRMLYTLNDMDFRVPVSMIQIPQKNTQ